LEVEDLEVEDLEVEDLEAEDLVVEDLEVEDLEVVDLEVEDLEVVDSEVEGTVASHNFVNMRLDKVLHRKVLVVSLSTERIDAPWFHTFQYTC
jgi:hypothetical protein